METIYQRNERVAGWEVISVGDQAAYWDGNRVRHGLVDAVHFGWKHQWIKVSNSTRKIWIDEKRGLPRSKPVVLYVRTTAVDGKNGS